MIRSLRAGAVLVFSVIAAAPAEAAELVGSLRSMTSQHGVAVRDSLAFLASQTEMRRMVASGELVAVEGNADYVVDVQVPHRFARPEIKLFLERLGAQYRAETGYKLVVTSLVRPSSEQPSNAHKLSVHPAGMAIDLRIPAVASHREWLERTLLSLEQQGALDVTREKRPPHYHVAVFPKEYSALVARREVARRDTATREALLEVVAATRQPAAVPAPDPSSSRGPLPFALAGLALGVGVTGGVVRRRERRRQPR